MVAISIVACANNPIRSYKSESDILADIQELEIRLNHIDYSDEIRKALNIHLTKLKALVSEPSNDTHSYNKKEPSLDTQIKYIANNFKLN